MKVIKLNRGFSTLVDDEDFEFLSQWKWHAGATPDGNWYACRTVRSEGRTTFIWMHKVLCPGDPTRKVDHKNRDSLDNRKKNLRIATNSQNGANASKSKNNTSGFKGVTWCKASKKWQAQIMVNRKHIYLGLFEDKREAAAEYDRKAKELFGEFAATNRMLGILSN